MIITGSRWTQARWPVLAGLGGLASAAGLGSIGASFGVIGFGGAATAGSIYALAGVATLRAEAHSLKATVTHLQGEVAQLREWRDSQDARLVEVERKAAESPALVWRAVTADIETLGSIVTSLAKTVSEHEVRLKERPSQGADDIAPAPAEAKGPDRQSPVTASPASPAPITSPALIPELGELRSTVATVLASERLSFCLQPIVTLPQRQIIGYEASLRLSDEDGTLQSAQDLRRIAGAGRMGFELDRHLLEQSVQVLRVLRARNREVFIVCDVFSDSLGDIRMQELLAGLLRGDDRIGRSLILCAPGPDLMALPADQAESASLLRQLGPVLAARVPYGQTSAIRPLQALGVEHLRIDAATLLAAIETGQPFGDIHAADLSELLARSGIDLSVTDIAHEETVHDLADYAVTLAQGDLFGATRPVRPEVLLPRAISDGDPTEAQMEGVTAQESPAPQRQSFRAFLRRA